MLYAGDTIDEQEALRLGMVNRVVPRDRLTREQGLKAALNWRDSRYGTGV